MLPAGSSRWQVFIDSTEPSSAKVRDYFEDFALEEYVELLDLAAGPHARLRLEALGGERIPALWNGEGLTEGSEAVIAKLSAITNIGRTPW